jgi:mRNA-degrading endonuclease toxin of MazEF toxin-antitoxin module
MPQRQRGQVRVRHEIAMRAGQRCVFNQLTGRCIACPITRRDRDWSFHVPIPDGCEISGVVQADQLRSVLWEQRGSRFICKAPAGVLDEVRARLKPLLSL